MTRMTPSEAFVETMVANGVTTTFGIMGSAFMDAMDIFAPAGIELVPVVHEQGAAHMADGYARVSGRHGVVIGQNGPGISNCVTAIAAAFWAHSPVVIVTPQTGSMGIGLGGFQEANQLPMFEEFVKFQAHIDNENRMAELTARAFDRALSEIGPTQINIPRDRFYGDIDVEIAEPMRLDRGAGGKASLDAAADMLAEAEFPVIVSGVGGDGRCDGRSRRPRRASRGAGGQQLPPQRLVPGESSAVVRAAGLSGLEGGDEAHRQGRCRACARHPARPFGTLPQHDMDYWPKDAKIIQVDADHKMLGLVKPISSASTAMPVPPPKRSSSASTAGPSSATQRATPRRHHCRGEGGLGSRTRRVDPRKDDFSMDMIAEADAEEGSWLHPARCSVNWRRRCPPGRWSRPTSATSTRSPTAICASRNRGRSSPR